MSLASNLVSSIPPLVFWLLTFKSLILINALLASEAAFWMHYTIALIIVCSATNIAFAFSKWVRDQFCNCNTSGSHRCPNPNCNARFSSKKTLLRAFPFPLLRTASIFHMLPFQAFITQAQIEPGYDGWSRLCECS